MTLLDDYKAGMPIKEIAKKWAVSERKVNYQAKKAGLQGNRRWAKSKYIRHLNRSRPEAIKDIVWGYLEKGHCQSCDENNPLLLQFDHINPDLKSFSISDAVSGTTTVTLLRLEYEISKCRILCASCHQLRSMKQQNNWRIEYANR